MRLRQSAVVAAAIFLGTAEAPPASAQMGAPSIAYPVTGTMCDMPDTVKGFNEFLLRYPTDGKIAEAIKAFGGGCEQKTWMAYEKGIVDNFGRSDGRVIDIVLYRTLDGPRFSWVARPVGQAQSI
jgi:hypothetical protein